MSMHRPVFQISLHLQNREALLEKFIFLVIYIHVNECQVSHIFQLYRTEESKKNTSRLAAVARASGSVLTA